MTTLAEIPAARRRQVAGVLGVFAVLLAAVGAVAVTGAGSALLTAFGAIALLAALLLALLAWGVLTSLRNERAEREHEAALDAVVAQALAAAGEIGPRSCGHDHDPDELHVTGDPCEHDGGGVECSQSCDTCVLARLRPTGRPSPSVRP